VDIFLHTLPNISDCFQSLESTIGNAVTGQSVSDLERDLSALPVWLGLCDPTSTTTTADFEFNSSVLVTSPLIHEIIQ